MYKKLIIYALIIFFTIVIIGNYSVYRVKDKKCNSLDFSAIEKSALKTDVSEDGRMIEYLNKKIEKLKNGEYEEVYNVLTAECKQKLFSNSLNTFSEVIKQKYIAKDSEYQVNDAGFSEDSNIFLFSIKTYTPVYIPEEQKKLEVYKPKEWYIEVYVDENNNYTIYFDV